MRENRLFSQLNDHFWLFNQNINISFFLSKVQKRKTPPLSLWIILIRLYHLLFSSLISKTRKTISTKVLGFCQNAFKIDLPLVDSLLFQLSLFLFKYMRKWNWNIEKENGPSAQIYRIRICSLFECRKYERTKRLRVCPNNVLAAQFHFSNLEWNALSRVGQRADDPIPHYSREITIQYSLIGDERAYMMEITWPPSYHFCCSRLSPDFSARSNSDFYIFKIERLRKKRFFFEYLLKKNSKYRENWMIFSRKTTCKMTMFF